MATWGPLELVVVEVNGVALDALVVAVVVTAVVAVVTIAVAGGV